MQGKDKQHSMLFEDKTACFFTKDYQLTAQNLAETISLPAIDIDRLNHQVMTCFSQLQKEEGTTPILIGAIPFDTSKPSSLNIYREYTQQETNIKQPLKQPLEIKNKKQLVEYAYFDQAIQHALEQFSQEKLSKIVLSQAADFELLNQHTADDLAFHLAAQNPTAYSFVVPVDQGRYLLGASPELLMAKHQDTVCSNPLAGSRPRSTDLKTNITHENELKTSKKDLHEHQIVVDCILKNLQPLCTSLQYSKTPEILTTPTMLHLSSMFKGQVKDTRSNALSLALALHPTPAICGAPTKLAKDFILKHEGYDREYYAGLVGWMDAQGNGEWVVTIRCGLLDGTNIRLYAGAGIVEGSEAMLEWNETEAKMQTMLKALCNRTV